MGLPGKRLSRSSKRRRAAHFALENKVLGSCPQCKKPVMPHRACVACGTYKGRAVISLKTPKVSTATKAHDHDHDHKDEK